jgi:methanogenic corrinoid protein MtbC1
VTADFARRIGADSYAPDASQAVALAKSLIAR